MCPSSRAVNQLIAQVTVTLANVSTGAAIGVD